MNWSQRLKISFKVGLILFAVTAGNNIKAQDPDTITAIEIRGISKVSRETVLFRSGLKVGDELRTIDFSNILQVLWEMKAFDDIKINVEDAEQGKKVIIIVTERPIIKEIDYRGGTEIGLTSIKDKVKDKKAEIRIDAPYDPDAVRKIKDIIVDLASEKGFRSPSIEVSLEPMGPGLARLLFDIKEGGKNRIYQIKF
ncbi:MAG: outer membrane protein YaeT, partial [Acidobacteriota bacterium]